MVVSSSHRLTRLVITLLLGWTSQIGASFYEDDSHVKLISKKYDFDNDVINSDTVWLVQFYMPGCGHCQALKPKFSTVANIVRGVFHFAAIDGTSGEGQEIASKYAVTGFPALFIFGKDKTNPVPLKKHDPQSMIQALMDETIDMFQSRGTSSSKTKRNSNSNSNSNSDTNEQQKKKSYGTTRDKSAVVQLTDANFHDKVLNNSDIIMVAFVAPWCGYCKQLLPEWEEAAADLRGQGAMLGVLDATQEQSITAQYKVTGYPTIKVFKGGTPKSAADAQDYEGERSATAIVKFALDEIDRSGIPKQIDELVSQAVFDEACQGRNRICVLVALPHILDSTADRRNAKRDLLSLIQKSFRPAFSFLWFEGGSQPKLEKALQLTFGFPAIVAVSVERHAYAVLKGSFSEKSIKTFLHGITSGRTKTIKLSHAIPSVVTTEPWDGLDGTVEEEEFSLEDIMGWDEEEGGEL